MRKSILISISIGLIILFVSAQIINTFRKKPDLKYKPNSELSNFGKEEGEEQQIGDAVKYLSQMKNNQVTGRLDMSDVNNAIQQILNLPSLKSTNSVNWKEMGPDNIGGRTRAILFDIRDGSLQTLYAGGVSGGLWKSTSLGSSWKKIVLTQKSGFIENINIDCIAQGPDSTIYIGTGEEMAVPGGTGSNTGFVGNGIYYLIKSQKNQDSFVFMPSTHNVSGWEFVNKLAVNQKNGWIFAATGVGLMVSKNKGTSWTRAITITGTPNAKSTDVKIGTDQMTVVAAVGDQQEFCFVSTDGGATFTKKTTGLPTSDVRRIEFGIAPSDPNIIYALIANNAGLLGGVYQSLDRGNTWTEIGPGGSQTFQIFGANGQGWYDNVIAVFPNNSKRILAAGVDLYEWQENKTWLKKTYSSSYPIHADMHTIVFHPKNPNMYFIGTDGGVYRTIDAGDTYASINLNYNVTQFYALAISPDLSDTITKYPKLIIKNIDEVMGGTQDNGTPYITQKFNGDMGAVQAAGGDGGWSSFSMINPNALYVSLYYSTVYRNPDKSSAYSWQSSNDWYGGNFKNKWGMLGYGTDKNSDGIPDNYGSIFVSQFLLWETFNDIFSKDYVTYKAEKNDTLGQTVIVRSKNNNFPFDYVLQKKLDKDSSIQVLDKIQSIFVMPLDNHIWMTKGACDFSITPKWFEIANLPTTGGLCRTMAMSKDGNNLFIGTDFGNIYRISNLRFAYDSLTASYHSKYDLISITQLSGFSSTSRTVTSISVDPTDASHIIVTLGNYGNQQYIYESTNALDKAPILTDKTGNLPKMPVYASLIEMHNRNLVFVGTEFGTYMTKNISVATPQWEEANFDPKHMERVPTFMLRQQINKYDGDYAPTGVAAYPFKKIKHNVYVQNVNNYGDIYAATHGRGIYKTDQYHDFVLGIDNNKPKSENKPELKVYPNPASDNINISFVLPKPSNVSIRIYDMKGREVKLVNHTNKSFGANNTAIDVRGLSKGTYIVNLTAGEHSVSSKIIISR